MVETERILLGELELLAPAGEVPAPDWREVLRRIEPVPSPRDPLQRLRRRALMPRLMVAVAAFLLLAAIASATYAILRSTAPSLQRRTLTFFVSNSGKDGPIEIDGLTTGGAMRVLWRCPHGRRWCGDPTSLDWSPDGKHLAFTLDEIGATNVYVGLHILDVKTGRDLHIPAVRVADPLASQPPSVFPGFTRQTRRRLGCLSPDEVAWSPDGRWLAYSCVNWIGGRSRGPLHTEIHIIRADGTGQRRVVTGLRSDASPSWSPDGRSLAFSGVSRIGDHPAIYTIRLDGSHRHLVARNGSTPAWAATPDGPEIAYQSKFGVKLATPNGVAITPAHLRNPSGILGPPGIPSWSRDGQVLAIGTTSGVYRIGRSGLGLARVTEKSSSSLGAVRPSWYPNRNLPRSPAAARTTTHPSSICGTC